MTKSHLKKRINILYPDHIEALQHENLSPKEFPTMKRILKGLKTLKQRKKNKRGGEFSQQTIVCVGVNNVFNRDKVIHATLKKHKLKYNLKWLRLSMAYHKFINMGDILQGGLTSTLMENIGLKDFEEMGATVTTQLRWMKMYLQWQM